MAKKKSKKDLTALIINVVIIALAVLTICSLFMPFIKGAYLTGGKEMFSTSAKGIDVFTAAFRGEGASELSEGANMLISLKTVGDHTFVATVMIWAYLLTVLVAVASLVFAILNVLGMNFKLVNTILGSVLVLLALVTFIFALITASKNTDLTEVAGYKNGSKFTALVAVYFMFAGMIAGCVQVYKARK